MELPVMKKVMKTISLFLCVMIFATSLPVFFAETESASAATATMVNEKGRIEIEDEVITQAFQSPLLIDYLNAKENILLPLTLQGKKEKETFTVKNDTRITKCS